MFILQIILIWTIAAIAAWALFYCLVKGNSDADDE
jgi:hypothetical protein